MKTSKHNIAMISFIASVFLCIPSVWATPGSSVYPSDDHNNEMITLDPGWRASCHSNFVVENMGETDATIEVRLGREVFAEDTITSQYSAAGNGKRFYNLRQSLGFAKQLGKTVEMDDVALVTNQSETASVIVHC